MSRDVLSEFRAEMHCQASQLLRACQTSMIAASSMHDMLSASAFCCRTEMLLAMILNPAARVSYADKRLDELIRRCVNATRPAYHLATTWGEYVSDADFVEVESKLSSAFATYRRGTS